MEDYAARARAKELFESGWNCAQAVLLAFAPVTGLPDELAARLASSFGGGMGRLREVCGTASASFMVLGLVYGGYDPRDREAKAAHYQRVQELAAGFRERNGSLVCRDILRRPKGPDGARPDARTAEYYAARPCARIVAEAAEALAAYLAAHPKE